MRRLCAALSLALLGAAGPAQAAPPRVTLVFCAPGYPGSTDEARPAMEALVAALTRATRWPEGALAALYLPGEAEGLARLAEPDAAVALLPLPFFLKHGPALGLTARLQVEMQGTGLSERWSLVARRGRITRPADLAHFTVLSLAGYAPAFVRNALGAWGHLPPETTVTSTAQVLSSLRKAAAGADVALLLDGTQSDALPSLPFAADLEVVARSGPLPTAVVATVGSRLAPARWDELSRALLGLASDPTGAAALAGIRLVRIVPADPAALAAARALVQGTAR